MDDEIKIVRRGTGAQAQGADQTPLEKRFSETLSGKATPVPSGQAQGAAPPDSGRPASEYVNMSWGDYLPIVASNVGPSSLNALKGMADAVMDPKGTAGAIYDLGRGVGSKAIDAAGSAVGYGPVLDPSKKAERESVADALGASYYNRYGGGEEGSVWKNLAEDPASYAADLASVVSLGSGTATKLGILDKAKKPAKFLKFAENLDPVQAAMNLAGKTATTTGKAVPYGLMAAQKFASGVPFKALNTAREVGLSGDPAKVQSFMSALKGNPNFTGDTAMALEKAINDMAAEANNAYMTSAQTAFARSQPVDMAGPTAARQTVYDMLNPNTVLRAPVTYKASDIQAANDALFQIDSALTHPSNAGRTIEELDVIKKSINRLSDQIEDPSLQGRVTNIANSLVDAMSETDPAYGDMMRGWQEYRHQLNNVRKDFGSERMSDSAKARKISKAFDSKYGDEMFSKLEGTPSGKNLRYSVAGDAMRDWLGDRTTSAIAGFGGPVTAAYFGATHPVAAMAAIPGALASSPKLGAYSQYALGRAERAVNDRVGRARGYVSAPVSNIASQIGSEEDPREGRKSGGRVSSHDAAADQLVRAAERAKKGWSAETAPLLNHSDETVVKALEVANRSI